MITIITNGEITTQEFIDGLSTMDDNIYGYHVDSSLYDATMTYRANDSALFTASKRKYISDLYTSDNQIKVKHTRRPPFTRDLVNYRIPDDMWEIAITLYFNEIEA